MPAAGHALAGAVGSAIANLATYPLDVVSTRLKVQRHAMAQRLEREELQRRHKGKSKKKEKTRRSSTSSSSSAVEEEPVGIFNVTQEQAKGYHKYETSTVVESWEYEYEDEELYSGHFDAVQKIYEKEGIRGFYHGVGWDTVGTAASGFWYFMACGCSPDVLWACVLMVERRYSPAEAAIAHPCVPRKAHADSSGNGRARNRYCGFSPVEACLNTV